VQPFARSPRARHASTVSPYRPAQHCQLPDKHHASFVVLQSLGGVKRHTHSKHMPENQQIKSQLWENQLEALLLNLVGTASYSVPKQAHAAFASAAPTHVDVLKQRWTVAAVLVLNRLPISTVKICRAHSYLVSITISRSYAN